MSKRTASVNYQERAQEFRVGQKVIPLLGHFPSDVGKVVAVWPAIGMVDVEMVTGTERFPAEQLQVYDHAGSYDGPETNSDTAPVATFSKEQVQKSATNVVHGYIKKAIYWASSDRRYKANQTEIDSGRYLCPKCKDSILKRAVYKRVEGKSERLLGCPECMFLVKASDLDGCHYHAPEEV